MTPRWRRAVATWLGFAALGVLAIVAARRVLPVGYGPAGVAAVTAAAAICLGAALVALVPPLVVAARAVEYLPHAGLAAMTLRLLLTLSIGAAYLRLAGPPARTFLMAGVVSYLVLLAAETAVVMGLARRSWRPAAR